MQNTISCPYKVFGLTPSATMDEVKRAYRREVKKYHPDSREAKTNPMAKTLFLRVQTAYEMIEKGISGTSTYQQQYQYNNTKTRQQQAKPKPKPQVRHFYTTVTLKDAFFGFNTIIDGQIWRVGEGVDDGDVFDIDSRTKLHVNITCEDGYIRSERDLHNLKPVKLTWKQANTIGSKIKIPHPAFPDDGLEWTLKEKINDGDSYTFFKKGYPKYGKTLRGNYHAKFSVEPRPVSFLRKLNPLRALNNYWSAVVKMDAGAQLFHSFIVAVILVGLLIGGAFIAAMR